MSASSQEPVKRPPILPLVLLAALVAGGLWSYSAVKSVTTPKPPMPSAQSAKMRYDAGIRLAQAGDLKGAQNEWQTAIGLNPADHAPYLALVKASEQEKNYAGAIQYLNALRGADRKAEHIVCRQAHYYLKLNRYETAAEAARIAAMEEPNCPQAHIAYGIVFAKAGAWMESLKEFQSAQTLLPGEPAIAAALAFDLAHIGRADEGAKLLESLPEKAKATPPILYRLSWLLSDYGRGGKKDDKTALELINQALAQTPDHPDYNAQQGAILLRAGKTPEARAAFDKALQTDPSNVVAARGMATVFRQLKLPEAAQAEQVAKRKEDEDADMRKARAHFLIAPEDGANTLKLAEWEGRDGNMPDALDLIKRVLQNDPNYTPALALLHRYVRRNSNTTEE